VDPLEGWFKGECVNSGMDYWNDGIVEWWNGKFLKVYFQI